MPISMAIPAADILGFCLISSSIFSEFDKPSIRSYVEGLGAVKQTSGVDYTEESHLLTPYFEQRIVEVKNELLPLLKYL